MQTLEPSPQCGPGSWAGERFVPSCSAWWAFGEESTE